ncbi:MAG TPA: universal stress protein [Terriglobia bacterium]|nr:universal stress protein [Terriglobia bacterium]
MKFKRILCGVDFSEYSLKAFKTAVELARLFKTDLHVIHVIETSLAMPEDALTLEEKAITALNALITQWATKLDNNQVTTEVTTGRASTEIINSARTREVDLIVLGAKGVTLLEEAFIGGTLEHVLKEASCSVLTVRN